MNIDKVPKNCRNLGDFKHERALELLNLVNEAHKRYDRATDKDKPKRDWENDLNPITVCGNRYDILANLGFAQYWFFKRSRVPFGFIAKNQNTHDIYVVFRGTMNSPEWISNFKFVQQSYEKADNLTLPKQKQSQTVPPKRLGRIHRGFYKTYTRPDAGGLIDLVYDFTPHKNYISMRDTVENVLSDPQKYLPGSRIFVTGHSLGGALAVLATAHIYLSKTIPFECPILYTFANPRVGDKEFANHFKTLECRITNSEDIVPMIPIPSLLLLSGRSPSGSGTLSLSKQLLSKVSYQHIGIPIYFTLQKGNIPKNHIIPTYLEALS